MVSVMLYPCMFCVALFMDLFVLCVACFIVFVNCLVKQFAMCLGLVAILLLNVMDVLNYVPRCCLPLIILLHYIHTSMMTTMKTMNGFKQHTLQAEELSQLI